MGDTVFPGGFDAAGAGAVWDLDTAAAEEVLGGERLRVSLVEHRDGRYRLHDLARDFAATRPEAARKAATELGDRRAEDRHMGNLSLAYAELGEVRRAIESYEQHFRGWADSCSPWNAYLGA